MFINTQEAKNKEYYKTMLKAAGSLSNLFSDSPEPYLGYRLVENLFCKSFDADNLSRHDTSIDAAKDNIGIGVKTFLYKNGKSYEKIAEFNRELDLFKGLDTEGKIQKVAELRNERIDFAKRTYNLSGMLYHCVARTSGKILIYETPMQTIDIGKIGNISVNRNTIRFTDGNNQYGFNISKSTLFKQFIADSMFTDFAVHIISDPFEALEKLFRETLQDLVFAPIQQAPHVFLPLFSLKDGDKYVPEKSALNQWNAGGRPRNISEVYLKVPAWVHQKHPNFFPSRDTKFTLKLPNKTQLKAKICQDNGKALMSDPNADLGNWILRDVMGLKDGELLTYEKLESLGLDSVVIYKHDEENFSMDFSRIGSYDEFILETENSLSDDE
jgi:hypothetical protein